MLHFNFSQARPVLVYISVLSTFYLTLFSTDYYLNGFCALTILFSENLPILLSTLVRDFYCSRIIWGENITTELALGTKTCSHLCCNSHFRWSEIGNEMLSLRSHCEDVWMWKPENKRVCFIITIFWELCCRQKIIELLLKRQKQLTAHLGWL